MNQALEKQQQASSTAQDRLLLTYQWALVPDEPEAGQGFQISATKAEGQSISLAERVSRRLRNDGRLSTVQAAAAIRHRLNQTPALWKAGHVRVGDLWSVYASYPYMPRLRDRQVLVDGLTQQPMLWEVEGFAFADDYDDETGRYRNLVLPSDPAGPVITDFTLIVRPEVAVAQREAEHRDRGVRNEMPVGAGRGADAPVEPRRPEAEEAPRKRRYFGTKSLRQDRYAMDFKTLADEILAPLSATPGVRLSVRVEVEAETDTGFDDAKIRTVSENAAVLKFEQSSFEDQ